MENIMELLMAFMGALLLTIAFMPFFIHFFQTKKMGQSIREEGPAWHQIKTGTPTMGGTVFVVVAILVSLLFSWLFNRLSGNLWLMVLTWFLFGGIGFVDDFISIFRHQNEGLTAKQKFLLQILFSALLVFLGSILGVEFSLNILKWNISHVMIIAIFAFFWITGFSNAVNLTDGLDGLATGLSIIAYGAYFGLAMKENQLDLALVAFTMVASLIGFLVFNRKPASIFMGDVGSLALGAGLAMLSILSKHPWSLLIIGLVFVIETLSVILQVVSFKKTGKRIFKMAPLHHHFEMSGWSEDKVVLIFWLVGLLASLLYFVL